MTIDGWIVELFLKWRDLLCTEESLNSESSLIWFDKLLFLEGECAPTGDGVDWAGSDY